MRGGGELRRNRLEHLGQREGGREALLAVPEWAADLFLHKTPTGGGEVQPYRFTGIQGASVVVAICGYWKSSKIFTICNLLIIICNFVNCLDKACNYRLWVSYSCAFVAPKAIKLYARFAAFMAYVLVSIAPLWRQRQ